MAHSDELREATVRLVLEDGLSVRAAARHHGVGPATVKRWLEAAATGQAPKGPAGADEEEVSELLLKKARNLLVTVDGQSDSKATLEIASAIDKLLTKYLSLSSGEAPTEVNVNQQMSPEMVAWAASLASRDRNASPA